MKAYLDWLAFNSSLYVCIVTAIYVFVFAGKSISCLAHTAWFSAFLWWLSPGAEDSGEITLDAERFGPALFTSDKEAGSKMKDASPQHASYMDAFHCRKKMKPWN